MIPVVLSDSGLTQDHLILSLVTAINASGGLHLGTDELTLDKPGLQIAPDEILLALPKARDTPYENEWLEVVDDDPLRAIIFNDHDVVAFKYVDDADFHIKKPEYEEPQ